MIKSIETLQENDSTMYFDELNMSYINELIDEYYDDMERKHLDPDLLKLNFEIGITYLFMDKFILAKQYLEKALYYNPRLVNYFIGLSYHKKAKVIEKSGNFSATKKNYDRAINYYKKALKEKGILPNDMILNELLKSVYKELGENLTLTNVVWDAAT